MKLRPVVMKLSETTINLLKNFKEINQSILFKKGNRLRTISVMKNILAEATISEELPKDFGIYDLSQFINGIELHKPSIPEFDFVNDNSDVQTLDLIHSVGDAESFCRSNALKYLSRYDKKGQAKRDILKAMHYCLLLYYFSGNTNNETQTRGYETF